MDPGSRASRPAGMTAGYVARSESFSLNLHLQQGGAETLAVRVERERGGDAAGERVAADELQRPQVRQLVAHELAAKNVAEVALDRRHRHALAQQREILLPIGDER